MPSYLFEHIAHPDARLVAAHQQEIHTDAPGRSW
jgi:hypothetical protein